MDFVKFLCKFPQLLMYLQEFFLYVCMWASFFGLYALQWKWLGCSGFTCAYELDISTCSLKCLQQFPALPAGSMFTLPYIYSVLKCVSNFSLWFTVHSSVTHNLIVIWLCFYWLFRFHPLFIFLCSLFKNIYRNFNVLHTNLLSVMCIVNIFSLSALHCFDYYVYMYFITDFFFLWM